MSNPPVRSGVPGLRWPGRPGPGARAGDRSRLGPKSLGRATRFVVDHAACPVLLVWPDAAPEVGTMPPPPHHPHLGER